MTVDVTDQIRSYAAVVDRAIAADRSSRHRAVRGPRRPARRNRIVAAVAFAAVAAVAVGIVVARSSDRSKIATGPGPTAVGSTTVGGVSSVGPDVNLGLSDLNVPSAYPVGREWQLTQAWSSPIEYWRASYVLFQEATRVCMLAKGFDYRVATFTDDEFLFERMNPLNEAVAKRFGYHVPEEPIQDPNPNASAAFQEAALSVHGCSNQAVDFATNGPSAAKLASQLDTLQPGADTAIAGFFATKVGQDLSRAWSNCMGRNGYSYASQDEAQGKFEGNPQVTDTELAVRLADLNCDKAVGLTKSRSEYEQAKLHDWLSQNAASINALADMVRAAQQEVSSRSLELSTRGADALQHP